MNSRAANPRKLIKSFSLEPYSSSDVGQRPDDTSDSDRPHTPSLKRTEFICSTAHNAHLQEDFLEDKSSLFGRPLPQQHLQTSAHRHSSSRRRHHHHHHGLKHVSSERLLRKFFHQPRAVDTQSLRSVSHSESNTRLTPVAEESARERPAKRSCVSSNGPLANGDPARRGIREPAEGGNKGPAGTEPAEGGIGDPEEEETDPAPQKPLRRPKRPVVSKRHRRTPSRDKKGQEDLRGPATLNGECHGVTEPERPSRPHRLSRQNSVVRPLRCPTVPPPPEDSPKLLFRRGTVTHALSHHPEMAESVEEGGPRTTDGPLASATTGLSKPLLTNGRFQNPWSTWRGLPSFWSMLRWKLCERDNTGLPGAKQLDEDLPVVPLDRDAIAQPPQAGIRVTWLGHATTLAQFEGVSVLTDPVFSERVSPVRFLGPKRYRPIPGTVHDLPQTLDAVVISHNHYDHLDRPSVLLLNARYGDTLHWLVPMGMQTWFQESGCKNVQELTWWDTTQIPGAATDRGVKFVFTPAQHWSRRGLTDTNKSLWGSWCILGHRHRFFFAGDTGYCEAFKEIGRQYGPFNLAAIPIGAYAPRWFMSPQHVDYNDALVIHDDIRARRSLGIHWGTFALAYEHFLEPKQELERAVKARNPDRSPDFFVLHHGESLLVAD